MEMTEKILMFIGGFTTCFVSLIVMGLFLVRKGVDKAINIKDQLNGSK